MDTSEYPARSIAVAVDGSEGAARAVVWAARHARLAHCTLVLVHTTPLGDVHGAVWVTLPEVGRRSSPEDAATPGEAATAVLEAAEGQARREGPELEIVRAPMVGDARAALLHLTRQVDLLVMGSRGRGPITSLAMGSVSSAVARHASCPVAIVREHDDVTAVRRVVVGVDATPESRRLVELAYRLASMHRVPLLVVHCYWDVVAAARGTGDLSVQDEEVTDLGVVLSELVAGLADDFPEVQADIVLRQGLVDTVLTGRALAGDVIVVGRRTQRSVRELLVGSVASAVLERAESTVLVVPQAETHTA